MAMAADVMIGKHVVLGVSGSISAFKAVALASELTKSGALVEVLLTPSAARFVTPLSFSAITHRSVTTDVFEASDRPVNHVTLGVEADVFVIAPATADCLAGLALGLGDDIVRLTALSSTAPLVVAPAMETFMYDHPATQENLETLRRRGAIIVEPESGRLASGRSGRGRLAELSSIVAAIRIALSPRRDLQGRRIVVTAGGTQEPIDPVRYIGNRSSGKMGFALAAAARARGATVVLIVGAATATPPPDVEIRAVGSAAELDVAVQKAIVGADAIIMAAAVADYRVAEISDHKLKRTGDDVILRLIPNPDIIAGIKGENLVKVGFAAETDDLLANAQSKLVRKGLDLIVANDVSSPGSGFGTDTNAVVLIDRFGAEPLPLLPKRDVADLVLDRVVRLLAREPPGAVD
jgi:phosphopantothenoylcysteine decarboxylase/phosphopantothenate--cysteine ligase